MERLLQNWLGSIIINDTEYDSIKSAESVLKTLSGNVHIILKSDHKKPLNHTTVQITDTTGEYEITVKPYMTKPATPEFDFMARWNDNNPMPMRIMQGVIEKETPGMVYMKLHGLAKPTITCYCCGKELTNPISRHYGIGPVCLSKLGIVREIDDVENIKEELVNIKWEGWVIRSSIISKKEVKSNE